MLDGMRNHAQSWGIKIAFGVIIVVFVFWGVGSFTAQPSGVATVNGEAITYADFQNEYASQMGFIKQAYPQISDEDLKNIGLEQQVLQSLIVRQLVSQEAERVGISISPVELRKEIANYQMFNDENGKFSNDIYLKTLKERGMTPGNFEALTMQSMLESKMRQNLGAAAYVSEMEVADLNNIQNQQATMDYIYFPASEYKDQVKIEEQEILDEYAKRSELYKVPAKASIEYIEIEPSHFAKPEAVKAEDVEKIYNERKDNEYSTPERVNASHIVLLLAKDAAPEEEAKVVEQIKNISERIANGEEFGALANEFSADAPQLKDGELGWFTRGQMVKDFEDAAFALEVGQISQPVRSEFGYHLIKLNGKEVAKTKSLAEVENEIRMELALPLAKPAMQEESDNLIIAAIGGKSIQDIAKEKNYELKKLEMADEQALMQEVGINKLDSQLILSSQPNKNIEKAMQSGDNYILAHITEIKAEGVKALEEVKAEITTWLEGTKSKELAKQQAETVRATFTDEAKVPPTEYEAQIKHSQPFSREGFIPEVGFNIDLVKAVFGAPKSEWLASAYVVDEGAVLAKPTEKVLPEGSNNPQNIEQLRASLLNAQKEEMYQIFLQNLWNNAKINILEPTLR